MSFETDPDSQLMLRVKHGDMAAFESLVEKFKQPVMGLVHRTLRDADEAEDIAQAVFVQVYKSRDRYQASARFTTWLFTITRNFCLNEIRRRVRHPAEALDQPLAGSDDTAGSLIPDASIRDAGDQSLSGELERKVDEAVRDLPELQRTALLLCREEDVSYDDIAKVLGTSLSATKSLIHRARETLKARLKPYIQTGEWSAGGPKKR